MARLHPYFDALPADELTPVEHTLRKALLKVLDSTGGRTFPLADWIDRRIGAEVETFVGPSGLVEIQPRGAAPARPPPPPAAVSKEAFFDSLPADGFPAPEEALREAVLEFLATWQSADLANIKQMNQYPEVQRRISEFLPRNIQLKDWIEHRIGGELEFRPNPRGGPDVVHLTDSAKQAVMFKYHQISQHKGGKGGPPPGPPMDKGKGGGKKGGYPMPPPMPPADATSSGNKREADRGVDKETFLASLPEDELLPAELALRDAMLGFLERWPEERPASAPETPNLGHLGSDAEVKRCRGELFRNSKVKLADWIEHRVGGEVELRPAPNGPEVCLRGSAPPPAAQARGGKGGGGGGGQRNNEEAKEQFFADLPGEDFLEAEEELRNALLAFIDTHGGEGPPAIADAGGEEMVAIARKALLPKGCPVTMKEWIDRRIGGEIETRAVAGGRVIFGLRGTLPETAAPAGKRRRTD